MAFRRQPTACSTPFIRSAQTTPFRISACHCWEKKGPLLSGPDLDVTLSKPYGDPRAFKQAVSGDRTKEEDLMPVLSVLLFGRIGTNGKGFYL